jgi:glycosyltransferase involved in cell wall biosynthesis
MKLKVSVLLICQNSEARLRRCLDSVKEFDEVVVVDGGSTDATEEIAKSYSNVNYICNQWPGFIEQRNFSIDSAKHEWCFMIDSDEACAPGLVGELEKIISSVDVKPIYEVMRTEFFMGKAIETGYGASAYQERLFQKKRIRYGGGLHHWHLLDGEHITPGHPGVGKINSKYRILHDENYGFIQWLKKLPRYSVLIGREKVKSKSRVSVLAIFLAFIGNFFKVWWKSRNEGRRGVLLALCEALYHASLKLYIYQHQSFPEFQEKQKGISLT